MYEKYIYSNESDAHHASLFIRRAFDLGYYESFGEEISIGEIGCGKGLLLKQLTTQFPLAQLQGIDSNPYIVEQAKKANPNLAIVCGNFTQTPWANNSLHIIISSRIFDYSDRGTFESTYSLQDLAHEVNRILIPGGTFIAHSDQEFYTHGHVIRIFENQGLRLRSRDVYSSYDKPT